MSQDVWGRGPCHIPELSMSEQILTTIKDGVIYMHFKDDNSLFLATPYSIVAYEALSWACHRMQFDRNGLRFNKVGNKQVNKLSRKLDLDDPHRDRFD